MAITGRDGKRLLRLMLAAVAGVCLCLGGRALTAGAEEAGAPPAGPLPARSVQTGAGYSYGILDGHGFLWREADGAWQERNAGLPVKTVYPFDQKEPRSLTAFGFDPAQPERVAAATGSGLYLSEDAGLTWKMLAAANRFRPNTYFTAVALSPFDRQTILVGTSFDGVFESRDLGKTWRSVTENLKQFYWGAGFWEEFAALAYDPLHQGRILCACGFGKGLYAIAGGKVEPLRLAGLQGNEPLNVLQYRLQATADPAAAAGPGWLLQLGGAGQSWTYDPGTGQLQAAEPQPAEAPPSPERAARLQRAAGRYGIYLTPYHAHGALLDKHIAFMKQNHFNAIVVDCKDDFGYLTYNSQLEQARKMGAVRPTINLQELVSKAKANGIYVIARLVVFKDQQLYNYEKNKYAAWDGPTNKPWRYLVKEGNRTVQKEYWVDPYAQEVWEYNLAAAQELQAAGVDEIQFDYIRFPTDGPTGRIKFRYRKEGMERIDALESFLSMARTKLQVPISTDLYGFSCWCRVEAWTGQNLEVFSHYIDAVCPMFYPSHFPSDFAKGGSYFDRAKLIYAEGTARANAIAGGRIQIRPYVQAFLLGGERKMTQPSYSAYLQSQLDGLAAAPSSGFLLWNQSNNYYMVTKPLDVKTN